MSSLNILQTKSIQKKHPRKSTKVECNASHGVSQKGWNRIYHEMIKGIKRLETWPTVR